MSEDFSAGFAVGVLFVLLFARAWAWWWQRRERKEDTAPAPTVLLCPYLERMQQEAVERERVRWN